MALITTQELRRRAGNLSPKQFADLRRQYGDTFLVPAQVVGHAYLWDESAISTVLNLRRDVRPSWFRPAKQGIR